MYTHILATLDGSALSEAILPELAKLAAGASVRISLLAVAADPIPITSEPRAYPERLIDATGSLQEATLQEIDVHKEGETHEQAIQRVESELKEYLEGHAAVLRGAGIETACFVAIGDPVQVIVERARSLGVDVIAMASHGRTGLSQLVSGSVAAQVIERSGLPVLVVRANGIQR